ncbi:MAG TPA: outer membrane beta-barrel protein [Vicinamibacterales bacterium]
MRRLSHIIGLCTAFTIGIALPLSAQTTKGQIAAGGDVGIFFPDEAFEKTVTLDAFAEYYATPNISVRGLLGWASPGFENMTEDHFRQVRLLFNGVYSWNGTQWHPYATAGAGAYFLRQLFDNAPDPDSEVRGGLNFGGGVEYYLDKTNKTMFKGELRFDIVSHPEGFPDATGVTVTFGIKRIL